MIITPRISDAGSSMIEPYCSAIFYNRTAQTVLVQLRDGRPHHPFPNCLDLIRGHVRLAEEADPKEVMTRHIDAQLSLKRNGKPLIYHLSPFEEYVDESNARQIVFYASTRYMADDLAHVDGNALLFIKESDLDLSKFAFGCDAVLRRFFQSEHMAK